MAALALGLGAAIAAPVLLLVAGQVAGSARGHGFPTDVVLAHSVHPFTLLQTLVGKEGTLLVLTSPFSGLEADFVRANNTFDVKRTPSKTGLFTEIFPRRSESAI